MSRGSVCPEEGGEEAVAVHVTRSGLTFPLGNSVTNLATWSFLFHQEKGRLEGVNYFVVIVCGGGLGVEFGFIHTVSGAPC